ncbi:MAG: helix-turn-helix transcriptional regulator [Eubacteriales bacterium]|nr:helix-turn-helix transcriptional regulator [Eubacteriales bacterium]
MSVNYKLLGKRIREVRVKRDMSQAELAAKCKTSAQYLSQIENGHKQASLQILVSIAESLEVSMDNLLAGNQVKNSKEYYYELSQLLNDCSSYERRIIYELVVAMKDVLKNNHDLLIREIYKI